MAKSLRATAIAGATIKIGTSYLPDSEEGPATTPNYQDAGLTSDGSRIVEEMETVEHTSEQLGGPYWDTISVRRYTINTTLDQLTIFNLALAWGYAQGDIQGSSSLVLSADDVDPNWYSLQIVANTTMDTSDNQRGTRTFEFDRVAVIGGAEYVDSRTERMRIGVSFKAYVDANNIFGRVYQSKAETAPGYGSA